MTTLRAAVRTAYSLTTVNWVTAGFMVRNTKYAVLIIFIVAAVVSPGTDVVSQCLMAGPMLGLPWGWNGVGPGWPNGRAGWFIR